MGDSSGGGAEPHLLIATVGVRDPWAGNEPMGPLRATVSLQPGRVVLVSNPGVSEQTELTVAAIHEALPECQVEVAEMAVDDPSDLERVSAAVRRIFDGVAGSKGAVSICATSGTPQLSVAVTLAAGAYFPDARHYQAKDPARALQDRLLIEASPELFRHHAEARTGFESLATCRLHEASTALGRRERSGLALAKERRHLFRAGRAAADASIALAAFDRSTAKRVLHELKLSALPGEAQELVTTQIEWVDGLSSRDADKNPQWPVELAALSLRQKRAGFAAEALVTAAVAFEVALRVRLRAVYDVNADVPSDEAVARLERLDVVNQKFRRIEGQQKLTDALGEYEPRFAEWLGSADNDGQRRSLAGARNNLVHKAAAPSGETLTESQALLDELFRFFGWPEATTVPTAPRALERLARALAGGVGIDLLPL